MNRNNIILSVTVGLALAVFCFIVVDEATPTDDTDFNAAHRSGLMLFTDARTGCQYIGRSGALTPRMGADGKQICGAKGGE